MTSEFSPDSRRVVTMDSDNTTQVWDAVSGRAIATLQNRSVEIFLARFSPNGRFLLTVGPEDGNTARVWDAASGRLLATLQGHADDVLDAEFAPDGRRIVTASADQTARVWNLACPALDATLPGSALFRAATSIDGARIVTTGNKVWATVTGKLVASLRRDAEEVLAAAFSSDHERIVIAGVTSTRVWNASSGELLATLQGSPGAIRWIEFSRSGQQIFATAGRDEAGKVWNADTGQLVAALDGTGAVFSPDGQRAVTVLRGTARVWDAPSGHQLLTLHSDMTELFGASFSPDGKRIVTEGPGMLQVWDAVTGERLGAGTCPSVCGGEVFSPDSRRLVTSGVDGPAQVLDVATGRVIALLPGKITALWDGGIFL